MKAVYPIYEGIVRGLATIPKRAFTELHRNIADELKVASSPEKKIRHIRKILNNFKIKFNKMNIDLKDSEHEILKQLNMIAKWRHYVWLNDKKYKQVLNDILSGKKGKNAWVDISLSERDIPEITKIKNKEDVIKIVEKYESRVDEIEKLIEKHPNKWSEFSTLLNWGLHGLRDLFNAIHAVISYGSKGI